MTANQQQPVSYVMGVGGGTQWLHNPRISMSVKGVALPFNNLFSVFHNFRNLLKMYFPAKSIRLPDSYLCNIRQTD
jgi:hypothetical protein